MPSMASQGGQDGQQGRKDDESEIYFLITKFLSRGPCQRTLQAIREEVEQFKLMPKRIDWLGHEHSRTFDEVDRSSGHIKSDHLLKLCSMVRSSFAQGSVNPSHRSLLGLDPQSMMGAKSGIASRINNESSLILRNGVPPLPAVSRLANDPTPHLRALVSREYSAHSNIQRTVPCDIYSKMKNHSRLLGHLSAVFCVSFDRTGRYIFTGADDRLVKIWSAFDGRLLSTLRGHGGEITDLAVNYENTLLASGSCDRTIRVWDLKTTAPVTILVGHSQQVTSVKFCPLIKGSKRYMTSTANDGNVCFWKWDASTNEFDPKPIKFNEKVKTSCHILSSSFSSGGMFLAIGSNDKHVRVYLVDSLNGPAKILEIETHTDIVDSLQFSNRSTRFLSGSRDGTSLIWSFESQRWKSLTLKMTDRLPSDPRLDEEEMVKIKVNMVGWTCDDQYVITSASDNSIKVWNPDTGQLIHSLRSHNDDVFVIEAHPKDPRIFLTGGHDGRVIIWNVISGKAIKIFENTINGQGFASIYDVKWSPDGQSIISTDSHGHLKTYGFGSSEKYDKIPREVFFHTDYRPLVRDINHYVIDEQTQCPPHLMPPPFLVDIDGNPHEPRYQRLVPGRETCNEQQLVPQIAIQNERGVGEILEAAIQNAPLLPPIPPPPVERAPTIDDMIQRLEREQQGQSQVQVDHGYAAAGENVEVRHRNSSGAHPVGPRREGEGVRQVPVFRGESRGAATSFRSRRDVVKPTKFYDQDSVLKRLKHLAEFERQYFEKQSRKKPVAVSVVKEPSKSQKKMTRRKQRLVQQSQGLNRGRIVPRRGLLHENPDIPEMSESSHDGSGAESWSESNSESESETEESDHDGWDGRRSKRRRQATNPAGGVGDGQEEESEESEEEAPAQSKKQIKEEAKKSKHDQLYKEISGKELPDNFKYPEWLSEVIPRRVPYFPQLGDEVVYFKKGHMAYLEEVKKSDAYDLVKQQQDILKKKSSRDQVCAKVVDIKYEVKPPRLVTLRLRVLEDDEETRDVFTVRFHDMPNVIDFIVLKQIYDDALARYDDLTPGARYRSIVDNEWWLGSIDGVLDTETSFQNITFKWDSGDIEPMSIWDLEPVVDKVEVDKGVGIPVLDSEHEEMRYKPTEKDDWPECGRDDECDRITQGLQIIMQFRIAEHFNVPVDLGSFPVYGMVIPYFIDLSLIKSRVENRFYRRKEALKFDISFIEKNCYEFNEPNSDMCTNAKMLTKVLLTFIDDIECYDPSPILAQLMEARSTDQKDAPVEECQPGPSRRSPSRRTVKKTRHGSSKPRTWQEGCIEMMEYLFTLDDSTPFRFPVDPILYPDYNTIVDTPMDLMTMREQLAEDLYETPQEFRKDLELVFENSRRYTPNSKSPIHNMADRLSNVCDEWLRGIFKSTSSGSKKSYRRPISKVTKKRMASGTSEDYASGPSSDQPGPSRVQKGRKPPARRGAVQPKVSIRNGKVKGEDFYKTLVLSDDSEEDEAPNEQNGGSDTEIEEKIDSDATEIDDDEEEPVAKRKVPGKRKATTKHVATARKKSKAQSGSDTEFEVESSSRSGSRTSVTTATSQETVSDSENHGRRGTRRAARTANSKNTKNGVSSKTRQQEEDGSDYDYGDGPRTKSQPVSSRGRVIKFKGHARTSQVC